MTYTNNYYFTYVYWNYMLLHKFYWIKWHGRATLQVMSVLHSSCVLRRFNFLFRCWRDCRTVHLCHIITLSCHSEMSQVPCSLILESGQIVWDWHYLGNHWQSEGGGSQLKAGWGHTTVSEWVEKTKMSCINIISLYSMLWYHISSHGIVSDHILLYIIFSCLIPLYLDNRLTSDDNITSTFRHRKRQTSWKNVIV